MWTLIKTYWHDFWFSPEKAKVQLRASFMLLGVVLTQVDLNWLPAPWPQVLRTAGAALMVLSAATKAGEKNTAATPAGPGAP